MFKIPVDNEIKPCALWLGKVQGYGVNYKYDKDLNIFFCKITIGRYY